jgi:hypothetical protein
MGAERLRTQRHENQAGTEVDCPENVSRHVRTTQTARRGFGLA